MSSTEPTGPPQPRAAELTTREFDRVAVVSIQGGGVYGLNMLGQLGAVFDAGILPIALSGTSAGAVIAVLVWAGYSPKDIRNMFVKLAIGRERSSSDPESLETLVDLLGPFGEPPLRYEYDRFCALADSIVAPFNGLSDHTSGAASRLTFAHLWGRLKLVRRRDVTFGLWSALLTGMLGLALWYEFGWVTACLIGVICAWLAIAAWVLRGVFRAAREVLRVARELFDHAWPHRGFFAGKRFETFIREKLRASPRLSHYRAELDGEELTFGRIAALRAAHPGDRKLHFVPLILTATDLDKRELVLIASHDERFANVCIAKAVRASAGFPVFFRPVDAASGMPTGCLVDGGVISNYPAWVFSRGLRRTLCETPEYRDLATRPWLNIGLRVVEGAANPGSAGSTAGFLKALFDLARGQVRDQLEKALSAPLPHTVTVEQPKNKTNAPPNVLDIHQLTDDKIRAMFAQGFEFASDIVKKMSFRLPVEDDTIREPLSRVLQQITAVLAHDDKSDFRLRANVFVPWDGALMLHYAVNMDGHPDRGMVLRNNAGLTGACYSLRRPCLCNLEVLRAWANVMIEHSPRATQLGMTPEQHLKVPEDRTWLINVPIFDPQDCWFLDEPPVLKPTTDGSVWAELPTDRDGAVLGVLNVDGAIPYSELDLPDQPEAALTDLRTTSILSLLFSCSIDIGRILSRAFARRD